MNAVIRMEILEVNAVHPSFAVTLLFLSEVCFCWIYSAVRTVPRVSSPENKAVRRKISARCKENGGRVCEHSATAGLPTFAQECAETVGAILNVKYPHVNICRETV